MQITRTPSETLLALIEGVAAGRGEVLADLYAPNTHVSHPFDPFGGQPLLSRESLREHFRTPPDALAVSREVVDVTVHETADPEVIIGEFAYACSVDATGKTFSIPAIFVVRVRDGLIVESRDYFDQVSRLRGYDELDLLRTGLPD